MSSTSGIEDSVDSAEDVVTVRSGLLAAFLGGPCLFGLGAGMEGGRKDGGEEGGEEGGELGGIEVPNKLTYQSC